MFSNEYVRYVTARREFKLSNDFEFIEFNDITELGIREGSPIPDQVEIFAAIKVGYKGEIPERYRTLNLVIGDWVEDNVERLTPEIHKRLKEHIEEKYPYTEVSGFDEDTSIWLDQLDYMPRIDPTQKSIIIEVELTLDSELAD